VDGKNWVAKKTALKTRNVGNKTEVRFTYEKKGDSRWLRGYKGKDQGNKGIM